MTCITRKQTLWSLSLSYQKKDGRAWPRPSFFWYDTDKALKVGFLVTHLIFHWVGEDGRGKRERFFGSRWNMGIALCFLCLIIHQSVRVTHGEGQRTWPHQAHHIWSLQRESARRISFHHTDPTRHYNGSLKHEQLVKLDLCFMFMPLNCSCSVSPFVAICQFLMKHEKYCDFLLCSQMYKAWTM